MTGAVLGFAHTVGEFGVVLMIGGNIPNRTKEFRSYARRRRKGRSFQIRKRQAQQEQKGG